MPILSWEKPKKVMSDAEYKSISADSAPPGVYTPNMSYDDKIKWKAKAFGGKNARVEIRKCFQMTGYYAQVCIVVYKEEDSEEGPRVLMSTNGKIPMSFDDIKDFQTAIEEAKKYLNII